LPLAKGLPWERYKTMCLCVCETERVELCWFFCMDRWERHIFKEIDLWFLRLN